MPIWIHVVNTQKPSFVFLCEKTRRRRIIFPNERTRRTSARGFCSGSAVSPATCRICWAVEGTPLSCHCKLERHSLISTGVKPIVLWLQMIDERLLCCRLPTWSGQLLWVTVMLAPYGSYQTVSGSGHQRSPTTPGHVRGLRTTSGFRWDTAGTLSQTLPSSLCSDLTQRGSSLSTIIGSLRCVSQPLLQRPNRLIHKCFYDMNVSFLWYERSPHHQGLLFTASDMHVIKHCTLVFKLKSCKLCLLLSCVSLFNYVPLCGTIYLWAAFSQN